jgi:Transposase DDE domain
VTVSRPGMPGSPLPMIWMPDGASSGTPSGSGTSCTSPRPAMTSRRAAARPQATAGPGGAVMKGLRGTSVPEPDHPRGHHRCHGARQPDDQRHLRRPGQEEPGPGRGYLDSGYLSGAIVVTTLATWGIALIGPLLADTSAQARAGLGYARADFTIDYDTRTVTCPQGKTSASWTPCTQRGQAAAVATFSVSDCVPCPARSLCTTSGRKRRQLTILPRALIPRRPATAVIAAYSDGHSPACSRTRRIAFALLSWLYRRDPALPGHFRHPPRGAHRPSQPPHPRLHYPRRGLHVAGNRARQLTTKSPYALASAALLAVCVIRVMLKIEVREVYVRTGPCDRPPHAAASCRARTCPVQRSTGGGFLTPDLTRCMRQKSELRCWSRGAPRAYDHERG